MYWWVSRGALQISEGLTWKRVHVRLSRRCCFDMPCRRTNESGNIIIRPMGLRRHCSGNMPMNVLMCHRGGWSEMGGARHKNIGWLTYQSQPRSHCTWFKPRTKTDPYWTGPNNYKVQALLNDNQCDIFDRTSLLFMLHNVLEALTWSPPDFWRSHVKRSSRETLPNSEGLTWSPLEF